MWGGYNDYNVTNVGIVGVCNNPVTGAEITSMGSEVSLGPDMDYLATGMNYALKSTQDYAYVYFPYDKRDETLRVDLTQAGDYIHVWLRTTTPSPVNVLFRAHGSRTGTLCRS